ncbi:hypothetical protein WT08_13415 [Burkholderia sp. MSMB1552]|nr:hypothetical protein WT08_13415 [Burkholderia sp. MSMB1552]KWZ50446.1 hypothetical protein WS92_23865 [Burkholderia sp. MSMB1588]
MISDMGQDVFEVGARVDAVELARADQTVHRGSPFAPAIGAGEQEVLATQSKLVFILPISGKKLKSIIVGIRCMVAASRFETSRIAAAAAWCMSTPALA